MRTIVWFRGKDLRLSDHAPLLDAAAAGEVIPLFVADPYFFAPDRARRLPHRMQFLLDSLQALEANLARLGSRLLVVEGRSVEVVPLLAHDWNADRVVAHRWVEPVGRERDRRVGERLGSKLQLYEGETLLPPGTLRTAGGRPYSVFGQFARAFFQTVALAPPLGPPRGLPPLPVGVSSGTALPTCEALGLTRNPALQAGGEQAAQNRLKRFLQKAAAAYPERRDRLDLPGTSRLSADLKFGTMSVRQVWRELEKSVPDRRAARSFQTELLWREFAYSTLWDSPEVLEEPFQPAFRGFPARSDERLWQCWVRGQTGYPIVDAAARQLLAEGFVHNRPRMVSASFLTKHLLIDYRRGEAHFMRYLTDGDWASNNAGWQWVAGCGCGAQPYFRVFNPVTQGRKFDPEGHFVRRWVPELGRLPAPYVHSPWEAPPEVLIKAGIRLGQDYPMPIVDHRLARERYLVTAARHLSRYASRRQDIRRPAPFFGPSGHAGHQDRGAQRTRRSGNAL